MRVLVGKRSALWNPFLCLRAPTKPHCAGAAHPDAPQLWGAQGIAAHGATHLHEAPGSSWAPVRFGVVGRMDTWGIGTKLIPIHSRPFRRGAAFRVGRTCREFASQGERERERTMRTRSVVLKSCFNEHMAKHVHNDAAWVAACDRKKTPRRRDARRGV